MPAARDLRARWLAAIARHRLVALLSAVAVVAVAVVIPVALRRPAKPIAHPPSPLPTSEVACGTRLIEPPPSAPTSGWQKVSLPAVDTCYRLTATSKDAGGIATDSAFVLEARAGTDVSSLERRIMSDPPAELSIKPVSGKPNQFRIQPRGRLLAGKVYRVSILSSPGGTVAQSWAFQVQDEVRVVQTLPADHATDVPLNTGIELTFSHDGITGVEDRFSISPKTAGRFETHDRTVVFVPKSLKAFTVYAVTLRPGVGATGSGKKTTSPFVFRFETGATSRTGETPTISLQFSRGVWESRPTDTPALGLFSETPPKSVPVRVNRIPTVEGFIDSLTGFTSIPAWAAQSRQRYKAPVSGYPVVLSFTGTLKRIGDSGDLYVIFPSRLAAGYYLVQARTRTGNIQAWLQVTDVATYVALSERRTLVWANDLASKGALAGATVRVAGTSFAEPTKSDGVALFATPTSLLRLTPSPLGSEPAAVGNLVITARDGRSSVAPMADVFTGFHEFQFREYLFEGNPAPYWRFLYSDRHLYHSDDKAHFWGLIRARENPIGSQQVVVRAIDYSTGTSGIAAETTVTSSKRGTFIGKLELRDLATGYYELQASIGKQVITSTAFEVKDFVKPAYKIDIAPSRHAVFSGHPVTVDVGATFFEGTPVPGLKLNYEGTASGSVVTGADGHGSIPFNPRVETIYSPFDYGYLGFTPVQPEEGEISGSISVQVFSSAVTIDASSVLRPGRATVSGSVFNVDLSRLNSGRAADSYDFKAGPAAGRTVTADVTEESYRRVETGETYDFVSKRVVKTYRYDPVSRPVGRFTARTDSRGRFSISFDASKERQYSAQLSVPDARGRLARAQVYVSLFSPDDTSPSLIPDEEGPFAPGDRVSLTLRKGTSDLPSGGANRYLFFQARNGIREYAARTQPAYAFSFSEQHVPNTEVFAVRFNGIGFEDDASGFNAVFDQKRRALTVSVEPQRAGYRPGETAVLDVEVTDRTGKPVAGAEVLLSAVDEAIFRLQEQSFYGDLDILTTLYQSVPAGILELRASHRTPVPSPGGEHGGEGGVRDDFRDTALFDRVTTNGEGRATVRFKLADNLTSWRVSAIAVTDNLFAGAGTGAVPVSLPMFVDVGANSTYLSADRPAIRVRAFGSSLKARDKVSFTITAPSLRRSPVTVSGRAFEGVDAALGALREGTHALTIEARSGSLSDTVKRTIVVLPSRLIQTANAYVDVRPGDRPVPAGSTAQRTTVVFSDRNRGRYYGALRALGWTSGDRLDQMLARNLSQALLLKYFKEESALPAVFAASRYQTPEGGIAIFPYAAADLMISAHAAIVAPEEFGRASLARYFSSVIGSEKETRERKIIALSGLAGLGQPVLADVQRLAARRDLSVRERVHVGLAAAALSDEDTASAIYRDLLTRFGEIRGDSVRLNTGKTADAILEATSLEGLLGAFLADDYAPLLFQYTVRSATRDILTIVEQAGYLTRALPRLPSAPVKFSYLYRGTRREASLERDQTLALSVTPDELRALDVRVDEGVLGVATSYLAALNPAKVRRDAAIGVTRAYEARAARGSVMLNENDLVRIRLDYVLGVKAVDGCYQVSDLLPSGLKPVSRPYERGIDDSTISWPYSIDGQRVSFCVSKSDKYRPLVYYARVIGTGRYVAEPAVIQAEAAQESINMTDSLRVEIE